MAGFIYRFGTERPDASGSEGKAHALSLHSHMTLFYNEGTVTRVTDGDDSVTVLGYACKPDCCLETYLSGWLENFTVGRIGEMKRELLGQYAVVVFKAGFFYLFSDFLQTRSIYYDPEGKTVGTSFRAVRPSPMSEPDEYKVFEFLAMRHCQYPAWLGNTTLDRRVKRLRPWEYLNLDSRTGAMEAIGIELQIDNTRITSLKEVTNRTLTVLREAVRHPAMRESRVESTLTGGFDSRLVTALVQEYYPETGLRTAVWNGRESLDHDVAMRVASAFSLPLCVYRSDPDARPEAFYAMTEGLVPRENAIITPILENVDYGVLGFGGSYGTELYSPLAYADGDSLIAGYVDRARKFVPANEAYYERFEEALRLELERIERHYPLACPDGRDVLRLFRLINTACFSAPIVSAFNIRGRQYEVFGTFPVIEAGLKIPYEYLGGKHTFGRFYLIPKHIMEQIAPKAAKIATTHFCPMRPLSLSSFVSYATGRLTRSRYYKRQAKFRTGKTKRLFLEREHLRYASGEWFEGFLLEYLRTEA